MSAVAGTVRGAGELGPAARMRASVLRGPGDVVVEERAVPQPGPGEVVVRVSSVGVCGSDTHYYDHGRIGRFVVESPLVLGHEAAGEVAALGSGVATLSVGQRVSVEPGVPDLTCPQCLAGRYNLCPNMRFFATPPIDGAFAEYVVVHAAFAHPVPDAVGDDAAARLRDDRLRPVPPRAPDDVAGADARYAVAHLRHLADLLVAPAVDRVLDGGRAGQEQPPVRVPRLVQVGVGPPVGGELGTG